MRYKFQGEPGMMLKVEIGTFYLQFDEQGELFISDDNPAFDRLKNAGYEPEYVGEEKVRTINRCKRCDFETDNKGELMAHYRLVHPKEE